MSKIDIAYIAGLMDGEAYIGIKKTTTLRNGRMNPQYQERIQIRMVDEDAIKFITNTFGGSYYKESPNSANGRPLYCFGTTDLLSVNILRSVLPYLRIKKRVAETVLELRALKDNPKKIAITKKSRNRWGQMVDVKRWQHSPEHLAECERLYQLCSDINHGLV